MKKKTEIFPSEEWKTIKDFPDYAISNYGRIKRITTAKNNFCKINRIMKVATETNGYSRIGLYRKGKVTRVLVHRLVALAFIGEPPSDKHEVAHYDNIRGNNHASNLRWATRKENHADKKAHGTSQCGARNGNSKLTLKQVMEIKYSGTKQLDLAKKFGVNKGTIWQIRNGLSWKHVN